jgi:hypothetical protein
MSSLPEERGRADVEEPLQVDVPLLELRVTFAPSDNTRQSQRLELGPSSSHPPRIAVISQPGVGQQPTPTPTPTPIAYDIFFSFRLNESMDEAEKLKAMIERTRPDVKCFLSGGGRNPNGTNIGIAIPTALKNAKMAIIMGSETYGKKTASNCSTFEEMDYILRKKPMFLLKMCEEWEEPQTDVMMGSHFLSKKWEGQVTQALVDEILERYDQVNSPEPAGRQLKARMAGQAGAGTSGDPNWKPDAECFYEMQNARDGLASVPQRAGRFIVMDFLSSSRSREAAERLESAGLDPTTIFNTEQLPNACGYLSAAWACSLRLLGLDFTMMDMESARIPNRCEYIALRNFELGHTRDPSSGQFLETVEVQKLVTLHNPDAPNTDPSWLAGPGSFNHWQEYLQRTLVQAHEHGRVHIMIVNTVALDTLHDIASGRHWFVVAWFMEPDAPAGPASAAASW